MVSDLYRAWWVWLAVVALTGVGEAAEPEVWQTDVQTGIRYQVLQAGDGPVVAPGDKVVLDYVGRVVGVAEPFAGSQQGGPLRMKAGEGQVLKGLQLGVIGMKPGERRLIRFGPELGFGPIARGAVPANAELEFDLTLLQIVPDVRMRIDRPGDGSPAKAGDIVTVRYRGWLTDGTLFDSSDERGQPMEFGLGSLQVIVGWNMGIVGMRPGEVRTLQVPAALAYGDKGKRQIPPGADLKFEVELLSTRPGIAWTLQKVGSGPAATAGATVECHVKLTSLTGEVLVDTQFRKPLRFRLDDSVQPRGLVLGILGMQKDEIRQIQIPAAWGTYNGPAAGKSLVAVVDMVSVSP